MGQTEILFGKYMISGKQASTLLNLGKQIDSKKNELSQEEEKEVVTILDDCNGDAVKAEAILRKLIMGTGCTLEQIAKLSGKTVEGLNGVTELDLSNTEISDLPAYKELLGLEILNLANTKITDITSFREFTNLKELRLAGTNINDKTVIKELKNLRYLTLGAINSADIDMLKELKNLKGLFFMIPANSGISYEQSEDVRKALPNCEITIMFEK